MNVQRHIYRIFVTIIENRILLLKILFLKMDPVPIFRVRVLDNPGHAIKIMAYFRYIDNKENYGMLQAIPQQLITRGAYGYHLNRWFEVFPRENILITSSTDLINDPAMVLKQVQEFVGVQVAVDEKNFVWDQETEHYCVIGPEDLDAKCMGSTKQRSKDAVYFRMDPLLYHKFENMVIFRSGNTYIHFIAQETRIVRKNFHQKRSTWTISKVVFLLELVVIINES